MSKLGWSDVNAMTRNVTRCINALEDDGRLTELMEMRHFIDGAIKSLQGQTANKAISESEKAYA